MSSVLGELSDLMKGSTALAPIVSHKIAHATLGASSSKRWMSCPGSIRMTDGLPNISSPDAQIGTAAHEVASLCLVSGQDAIEYLDRMVNKIMINEDITEAVQVYLDFVRAIYRPDEGDLMFVEESFSLESLNPPAPMFGTADVIIYKAKLKRLIVIDYKNGAGVVVEALENSQGRYYGSGAAIKLSHLDIREIEVVIVQPNAPHKDGPIRHELISAFELIEWRADLMDMARKTQDPNAELNAGDHCRFCGARDFCPELRRHAQEIAMAEFGDNQELTTMPPVPESLTDEELSRIAAGASILRTWLHAVMAELFARKKNGGGPDDWKIVEKKSRRKWKEQVEDVLIAKLAKLGIPQSHIFTQKVKSPAQMEKNAKAIGFKAADLKRLLEPLYDKKSSGYTLAPVSDARPAIAASPDIDFADDLPGETE